MRGDVIGKYSPRHDCITVFSRINYIVSEKINSEFVLSLFGENFKKLVLT